MTLHCDIITLFPDLVQPVLGQSMLKRAQEKGLLETRVHNLRDYTEGRHLVADDTPYGGGAGMVMKAEPVFRAVEALRRQYGESEAGTSLRLLLPSPQGRPFTQRLAEEFRDERRRLVFVCGHYEGIDERVRLGLAPEEISIGDYVLTGGELPALVMIDAAVRLIPGVLGDPESAERDSFAESLLDYPHYTRPAELRGLAVPEVLLSGNHEAIRLWRRKEALRSTYRKRPDLLRDRSLSDEDRRLLEVIVDEEAKEASV
ncbi:MAG: tRNA (guanosine(37)-N1)-methyltransferase TrmD [Nitrospirae bacterium RIFCSPLOWO2_02_FULL_62_14]|nr:MAG: tRNA (guanosine(37)-N1)-methyltransferase TrmD [Nitrospirae bacterium RIFCSPLOWO2_02_FULL_62_14]OGW70606.1 MAG: tRNA (guanosine(37)-N1)-methyltransferase TrmD [Nitrospirae bacterium RIFCSPLOWO2_01_FULL_62_17]